MKTTNKIQLTEEKATLFITLYAKAKDNCSKHSILNDETAEVIIKTVDYNFLEYNSFGNKLLVIRAKHFDELVQNFISENKNGIVLYLGCGLDSRILRLNPSAEIDWFDVDYPEVIQLRKIYYPEKESYKMIESSITETDWFERIPKNRPIVVIAEGVLEYLTNKEVKTLLTKLTDYFQHGQIIFDVMNSYAVDSAKKDLKNSTGAVHKWAVDDIGEVDSLNLKLKRISVISLFKSPYKRNLPFGFRFPMSIMSHVSRFKNMNRILQYQF